ncbi:hypothetical protein MM50RIKEN_18280 [Vescimonas coprocola]|uniref:Uncharacterized protein n=1 Tax=Vescimonas coprocola TaxID=2714355 RepID=A0A810Q644_9FIRM|nr:hypothetical protein MM50RIKEN_18280 [Vescimonas coprocola]
MLPPIPQLPIRRRRAVAPKDNGYPLDGGGARERIPADIGSSPCPLLHIAKKVIA